MIDASAPVPAIRRLTFASYNIHSCFGTDRKYQPERVRDVLAAIDADVVGLQEVDLRLLVDGRHQLAFLTDSLAMGAVAGPNFHDHRGHFGNALLTRLPVLQSRRIDLSVRRFEPRGALDVVLDFDGLPLRVVVTHLGLSAAERRLQVRRLLHALDEVNAHLPVVVMGDFNEWKPTGGALRGLNRRFGATLAPRTFPSRFPLLPLDRLWVWPPAAVRRIGVFRWPPLTRQASDHLPLRADLAWEAGDLPLAWRQGMSLPNEQASSAKG